MRMFNFIDFNIRMTHNFKKKLMRQGSFDC